MKKILLLILIIASISLTAQNRNDEIRLRSGSIIKCRIISVDNESQQIKYIDSKTGSEAFVLFKDIGSFEWDGILNKGFQSDISASRISNLPQKNSNLNNNLYIAGDHLIKAANYGHASIAVSLTGLTFLALPNILFQGSDNQDKYSAEIKFMHKAAIGCLATAVLLQAISYSHMKRSGQQIKLSNNIVVGGTNGIGLLYTLR